MAHVNSRTGQRHTDRCSGGLDDNKRIPPPGGLGEEASGWSGLSLRVQGLLMTTHCSVKQCAASLDRFPRRRWKLYQGTALQGRTALARFLLGATESGLPLSRRTRKSTGKRPAQFVTNRWLNMFLQMATLLLFGTEKAEEQKT